MGGYLDTSGISLEVDPLAKSMKNVSTGIGSESAFGDLFGNALSSSTQQGWLSPAISGLSAIGQGYLGYKQLGLAEDKYETQKDQWERMFAMSQDEYYRKLNNRRASAEQGNLYANQGNVSADQRMEIANKYDTGANLEGNTGYTPAQTSLFNNDPTNMKPSVFTQPGQPAQVTSKPSVFNTGASAFSPTGGNVTPPLQSPAGLAKSGQPRPNEVVRRKKKKDAKSGVSGGAQAPALG